METRTISKEALHRTRRRHNWALQWCMNYEKMQGSGFAFGMVPVIKELYETEEEQCQHLLRHAQFYNCHPAGSAAICGIACALEENGQSDTADSIKVALMGPMASVGDTIQGVLVKPLVSLIGAGMAAEGNWLSILMVTLPMIACFLARWPAFNIGYKQSLNLLNNMKSAFSFDKLQELASVLGLTVIGGFIPSILGSRLQLGFEMTKAITDPNTGEVVEQAFKLQESLDSLLPYILPILFVGLCFYLLKKKKMTPVKVILIIAVITFILGATGIMV